MLTTISYVKRATRAAGICAAVTMLIAGSANSTWAAGHGGGGGGGAGAGASANHGGFGGNSSAHISAQGIANSNGPNATDRVTGTARARERASDQGLAQGKGFNASQNAKVHGHTQNAR